MKKLQRHLKLKKTEEQHAQLRFVCNAYCKKRISITSIPGLRWRMFCYYMSESDKLPLTIGALKHHIMREHVKARGHARIDYQFFVEPLQSGYHEDDQ